MILAVLSVIMTRHAAGADSIPADEVNHGIFFPSPQLWGGFLQGGAVIWINILLLLLTAGGMIYVNRRFNVLRTLSVYFGGLFLIMAAATPVATVCFSGALLLPPAILTSMSLLLLSFNRPQETRHVLMAFFVLGTGALCEYGFLFYVPVFMIGLVQMRIFNLRTLLAAFLGVLAPLWIAWGTGLVSLGQLSEIDFSFPRVESISRLPGGYPFVAALAFTVFLGIALGLTNFIKIYAYNARARAINGLLSIVSVSTGVLAVVNYTNSLFYILLLDCCVAFQMGHFFRLYLHRRAYLLALALMVVYGALFFWSMS